MLRLYRIDLEMHYCVREVTGFPLDPFYCGVACPSATKKADRPHSFFNKSQLLVKKEHLTCVVAVVYVFFFQFGFLESLC